MFPGDVDSVILSYANGRVTHTYSVPPVTVTSKQALKDWIVTKNAQQGEIPVESRSACAAMCHRYDLATSQDYVSSWDATFNKYSTFLGILNGFEEQPLNLTNPWIMMNYTQSDLLAPSYNYPSSTTVKGFDKFYGSGGEWGGSQITPYRLDETAAYVEFNLSDISNKVGDSREAADFGDIDSFLGFDVLRNVQNNGIINSNGTYTTTVTVNVEDNWIQRISIIATIRNNTNLNTTVNFVSYSSTPSANKERDESHDGAFGREIGRASCRERV